MIFFTPSAHMPAQARVHQRVGYDDTALVVEVPYGYIIDSLTGTVSTSALAIFKCRFLSTQFPNFFTFLLGVINALNGIELLIGEPTKLSAPLIDLLWTDAQVFGD